MKQDTNLYKKERYARGLCVWCSQQRDTKRRLCADCRTKENSASRRKRETRKGNNACVRCGSAEKGPVSGLLCDRCCCQNVALTNLGDWSMGDALLLLFQRQGGLCAYTKTPLLLAGNASLDHKIPPTRGGSHSIENLQWVTKELNRLKGQWTHDEFISLCRQVACDYS